jgi:hypothetical protein
MDVCMATHRERETGFLNQNTPFSWTWDTVAVYSKLRLICFAKCADSALLTRKLIVQRGALLLGTSALCTVFMRKWFKYVNDHALRTRWGLCLTALMCLVKQSSYVPPPIVITGVTVCVFYSMHSKSSFFLWMVANNDQSKRGYTSASFAWRRISFVRNLHLPGHVICILRPPQRNGPASASRHRGRLIGHAMRSFPQLPS